MAQRPRSRLAPDQRRTQILDEALKLIGEQGYRGFTIQALGQRCGLSNAGLLHHFGSKDAFLLGVLDRIGKGEMSIIGPLALALTSQPSRTNLLIVLRAIVESAAAKPEVSRFTVLLMAESMATDHPAHQWFSARQQESRELLAKLASGWAAEPEAVALQVQAMLYGFFLQWLQETPRFSLTEQWDKAAEAVLPVERISTSS